MELIKAFIFGFTLALSIGPIALLILNNGIVYGHKAALRSALGAALADFTYALITFSVGTLVILNLIEHKQYIRTISSYVLLMFGAWMCWLAIHHKNDKASKPKRAAGLKTTYLLTIVNPLTIIGFSAFIGQISIQPDIVFSIALASAVFLGSLIVQLALALFGASLKNIFSNSNYILGVQLLSGFGIAVFGLLGLANT